MYAERLWSQQSAKSLSTRESQALSRLASENRQVITMCDIAEVLDIPRKSAKDMAYALKEKGWLERIAHGKNPGSNRTNPTFENFPQG